MEEHPAVYLSTDELMLRLFPEPLGDRYDEALARAQQYLLELAATLVAADTTVLFDGAAWTRADRRATTAFFRGRSLPCEWHWIDPPDEVWQAHIAARNREVLAGRSDAYYVDDGLLEKCLFQFEAPEDDESAVRVRSD